MNSKKSYPPSKSPSASLPSANYKPLPKSLPTDPAALDKQEAAIQKKLLERSLFRFVWAAWHVLEPSQMRDGWHLRLICDELEKVTRGLTKNLLLNLPPRHGKSLITSVFWPVWEWITKPSQQYLCVSYDLPLAHDLARKARDLIRSEWFQSRWGSRFTLADDQDAKGHYTNDKLGARISITVRGGATGKGGGRILIDDPHNVKNVETDAERESVLYWWGNVIKSRKNTPDAACVVVMQRCHEEDLTGHILATEVKEWRHICLPARYEVDAPRPYDPRDTEGQALWEEMYPIPALDELQRTMDPYAIEGQYQQRPVSRQGGAIDVGWFKMVPARPAAAQWVRSWDFAGSEGKGDKTAALQVGMDEDGRVYFDGQEGIYGQWGPGQVENVVKSIAQRDGQDVPIRIPQDPAQAGKSQVFHMVTRLLLGWRVYAKTASGSKLVQAGGWISQARVGNIYLVQGPWVTDFLKECRMFPRGKDDHLIDAASAGFDCLVEHGVGGASLTAKDLRAAGIESDSEDDEEETDDYERDRKVHNNKWGTGYRW